MEKGPLDYSAAHYLLFSGIGALGGLVAKLRFLSEEHPHCCWKCIVIRGICTGATGAFCGILTFWSGEALHIPQLLTAAIAGIVGHMGIRSLELGEEIVIRLISRIERYARLDDDR